MGCCCSEPEVQRPEDIYASLVIPKPPPIEVTEIKASSSDDIPLFAPVQSDDDEIVISDTGILQIDENEEENESENKTSSDEKEQISTSNSDPDAVHFAQVKESNKESGSFESDGE